MSADPIGIGDGVNLYGYSKVNPINYTDFEGKQSFKITDEQLRQTSSTKIQYLILKLGGIPGKSYENETQEQREKVIQKGRSLLIKNDLFDFTYTLPDQNEVIITNLPNKGVFQGRKGDLNEAGNRAVNLRNAKTLANMTGGIFGAAGAYFAGDAGSDFGAAVDGVFTAFGFTAMGRNTHVAQNEALKNETAELNRPRVEIIGRTEKESAPIGSSHPITQRAQEMKNQLREVDNWRDLPVGVAEPSNTGGIRIVTVGSIKAYDAIRSGRIKLKPGEMLGPRPRFHNDARGKELREESHVEAMGASHSYYIFGRSGGQVGTVPPRCIGCAGRMEGSDWEHTNPKP